MEVANALSCSGVSRSGSSETRTNPTCARPAESSAASSRFISATIAGQVWVQRV